MNTPPSVLQRALPDTCPGPDRMGPHCLVECTSCDDTWWGYVADLDDDDTYILDVQYERRHPNTTHHRDGMLPACADPADVTET